MLANIAKKRSNTRDDLYLENPYGKKKPLAPTDDLHYDERVTMQGL
jgi:hypothetical protein